MLPFLKLKAMLSSTTITSTFVRFIPKAKANGHNFNYSFSSSFSSIQLQYPPLEHQWSGLDNWRHGPLNRNRFWGPNGPIQDLNQSGKDTGMGTDPSLVLLSSCSSLAEMGAVVLSTADPLTKSKLSHFAYDKWRREGLPIGVSQAPPRPARPLKPQLLATIRGEDSIIVVDWEKHAQLSSDGQASKLQIEARKELQPSCSAKYLISGSCIPEVSPKEIPPPKTSGLPLNAYMLHNLAHVELNAVDLAWDTVVRFSPYSELLGEGFFADFSHVADDESRHFSWCSQRLAELGLSYGDMPAHNFLWRECEKSSDNIAARLAVIPLVQEARGLDAGPRLVKKLIGFGDHRTSNIVAKIADEEVAHVAVGVYWFVSVCQKMGRAPSSTFKDMLEEYNVELKGPFNYSARDEAGIPRQWYDPSSTKKDEENNKLSEVYDRLACIISMEQENSSLGRTPKMTVT